MWDTNTLWFDVAIVMGVFALGSMLFGHFEEHKGGTPQNSDRPLRCKIAASRGGT